MNKLKSPSIINKKKSSIISLKLILVEHIINVLVRGTVKVKGKLFSEIHIVTPND